MTSIPHIQKDLLIKCDQLITYVNNNLPKLMNEIPGQQQIVSDEKEVFNNIKKQPDFPQNKNQQFIFLKLNGIHTTVSNETIHLVSEIELNKMILKKEQLLRDKEFAEKNIKWCNNMLKLFDQLEKNETIDYELFIEIEGEKVVIIKTTPDSKKH